MKVGGTVREVSFHWWLIGNERWAHVGLSNTVAGGEMNDRFSGVARNPILICKDHSMHPSKKLDGR